MQFNREKTLRVIKIIANFGKVMEKQGEAITAMGKVTSKLFGNEDFQVELTNSCEIVFNTARDRVFGLVDHYRHLVEEDVEVAICKMGEYEEACENISNTENKEDLQ